MDKADPRPFARRSSGNGWVLPPDPGSLTPAGANLRTGPSRGADRNHATVSAQDASTNTCCPNTLMRTALTA